jgi:uncharacterized protein (TIGR03435 family)
MCVPLGGLITQAFNLAPFEQPLGMPKWLNDGTISHNISIEAKAPEGVAPDPQNNAQARDLMNAMIRALLADRYTMVTHYEERPVDAYTLVAAKPKLATADASRRTGCTRQNQPQQGSGIITRLVCTNMTMAQFAEQIPAYYTEFYPVLDGTHLEGAFDFALNYNPVANLLERLPQIGRDAPSDGQASDPSGAISFVDAIEKQLGLKLEKQKRPELVLVIDHIEEKPTEN